MNKISVLFRSSVERALYKRGMTQAELARKLAVSTASMSKMLGVANPQLENIALIAEALEVPAFYLLMSEEERAKWDAASSPGPADAVARRLEAVEKVLGISPGQTAVDPHKLQQVAERVAEIREQRSPSKKKA